MELKEALHVLFEMASKQPNLVGGENKGGKAREKDWDPVEAFNSDSCSGVATMTTGKTSRKKRVYCSSVGREAREDAGAVAMDASHYSNMLCGFRERNKVSLNVNWRYYLRILDTELLARGGKGKKFSFFWDKCDIVPLAVFHGKKEEILEVEDVVGLEHTVIRLTYTRNDGGSEVDAEVGELGNIKLVIVGQLIQPVAVHPALLHTQLVHDGAHKGLGPLAKSSPISKPVVQIDKALIGAACFKSVHNNALFRNEVKSTFCIQEEEENRFLCREEGEIDGLSKEKSSKFVA